MGGRNTGRRRVRARERIMTAAEERFRTEGIAATGIDAIGAHAAVGGASLCDDVAFTAELFEECLVPRHGERLQLCRRRLAPASDPSGSLRGRYPAAGLVAAL